jgi:hypothetical protein
VERQKSSALTVEVSIFIVPPTIETHHNQSLVPMTAQLNR